MDDVNYATYGAGYHTFLSGLNAGGSGGVGGVGSGALTPPGVLGVCRIWWSV